MKKLPILMVAAILCAINSFAQFTSITNLTPLPVTSNTEGKPQSKVWAYAGEQWSVFPNSTGMYVWRLVNNTWLNVFKISNSSTGRADIKVVGNVAHIFLYKGASASQLVSLEYVPAQNTYKLWTVRKQAVGLNLDNGIETGTIDIDGTGRMWLASNGKNEINVRWSDYPYNSWSGPINMCNTVDPDDICTVTYLPIPQQIAVMWSNQNKKHFGFRTHNDGASPTTWSEDEIPASQSAVNSGKGMGDDHMNTALASDGTLYCAVKTSFNKSVYPELGLLIRRPSGKWDNLYEVDNKGTRPFVILNETTGKLKMVYASQDGGGDIVYKESSMSNIEFSPQYHLITGFYNNPTRMKVNYSSELVILASDTSSVVGVIASDVPIRKAAETNQSLIDNNNNSGSIPAQLKPVSPLKSLKVNRNPTSAIKTIKFKVPIGKEYLVSLYNQAGDQVALLKEGQSNTRAGLKLDIDGLKYPPGNYVVKLQTLKGIKSKRITLKKLS
jgi:hypothetical protein